MMLFWYWYLHFESPPVNKIYIYSTLKSALVQKTNGAAITFFYLFSFQHKTIVPGIHFLNTALFWYNGINLFFFIKAKPEHYCTAENVSEYNCQMNVHFLMISVVQSNRLDTSSSRQITPAVLF